MGFEPGLSRPRRCAISASASGLNMRWRTQVAVRQRGGKGQRHASFVDRCLSTRDDAARRFRLAASAQAAPGELRRARFHGTATLEPGVSAARSRVVRDSGAQFAGRHEVAAYRRESKPARRVDGRWARRFHALAGASATPGAACGSRTTSPTISIIIARHHEGERLNRHYFPERTHSVDEHRRSSSHASLAGRQHSDAGRDEEN